MPENAKTNRGPIDTSIPYRPTGWDPICTTSPNGMMDSDVTAVRIAIAGAIWYRKVAAVAGRNGSLVASLMISATG